MLDLLFDVSLAGLAISIGVAGVLIIRSSLFGDSE